MIIVLTAARFAALYVIFGKLHQPDSKLKQILSYCIMAIEFPLVSFLAGAEYTDVVIFTLVDLVAFLILGLLCCREGDRSRPIVSAFYSLAMFMMIMFSASGYGITFLGFEYAPLPKGVFTLIEFLLNLLWAIFYYYVARKMPAVFPLAFSLLTVLMPVIALIIEMGIVNNVQQLIKEENGLMALKSGLFLYSGHLGVLIIAANMCAFYLYVRLAVTYESLRFAQELSQTPPIWTTEDGLSELFISKYQITPREQQVIETLLLGKTDKEISLALDLAVNTVQAHLKRIYRKTDTSGRFALIALVRG